MNASTAREKKDSNDLRDALEGFLEALDGRVKQIAQEAVQGNSNLRAFSIREVRERLGASEYMVRKMIADGRLIAFRPTEGTVRITAESLRRLLNSDKVSSL